METNVDMLKGTGIEFSSEGKCVSWGIIHSNAQNELKSNKKWWLQLENNRDFEKCPQYV